MPVMSWTLDAWRSAGQLSRLRGHEIFWVDTGERERPVILMIHGFPTASWDWTPIWPSLHAEHRLVAFDLLGFGFSAKPKRHAYSILEQADIVEALVRELGLEDFHVLAHDYGDTVAQELLARQNEGTGAGRWRSLALLNGGLFPETHRPRPIQRLLLSPVGPLLSRWTNRRIFERALSNVFGPNTQPTRAQLDDFWALVSGDGGLRIAHRLIRYMPERIEHRTRWVNALQRASIPLALINGSVDPVSGAHMVRRFRELVKREAEIVELPTIGHYPQVEDPAAVASAYTAFLSRVGSPSTAP